MAAARRAHGGSLAARRPLFSYKPPLASEARRRQRRWRRRRNLPASRATSARRPAHRTPRPAASGRVRGRGWGARRGAGGARAPGWDGARTGRGRGEDGTRTGRGPGQDPGEGASLRAGLAGAPGRARGARPRCLVACSQARVVTAQPKRSAKAAARVLYLSFSLRFQTRAPTPKPPPPSLFPEPSRRPPATVSHPLSGACRSTGQTEITTLA